MVNTATFVEAKQRWDGETVLGVTAILVVLSAAAAIAIMGLWSLFVNVTNKDATPAEQRISDMARLHLRGGISEELMGVEARHAEMAWDVPEEKFSALVDQRTAVLAQYCNNLEKISTPARVAQKLLHTKDIDACNKAATPYR